MRPSEKANLGLDRGIDRKKIYGGRETLAVLSSEDVSKGSTQVLSEMIKKSKGKSVVLPESKPHGFRDR